MATWPQRRDLAPVGRRGRPAAPGVWTVTTLVLVALSFGVFGLRVGQPADEMYTTDVGSVVGQRIIDEHYASGTSSPAQIVAAAAHASTGRRGGARRSHGVAAATPVGGVSADGRWVRVEAVLADPPDSPAAEDTVDRLRSRDARGARVPTRWSAARPPRRWTSNARRTATTGS